MGGVGGALICWFGLFGPGIILMGAMFPFWMKYREQQLLKVALDGINASAIGLVVVAVFVLYQKLIAGSPFHIILLMLTVASVDQWKLPAPGNLKVIQLHFQWPFSWLVYLAPLIMEFKMPVECLHELIL